MKRFFTVVLAMAMMGTTVFGAEAKDFAKAKPVEQKIELDDYNVEMKEHWYYLFQSLPDTEKAVKAMRKIKHLDEYRILVKSILCQ